MRSWFASEPHNVSDQLKTLLSNGGESPWKVVKMIHVPHQVYLQYLVQLVFQHAECVPSHKVVSTHPHPMLMRTILAPVDCWTKASVHTLIVLCVAL